MKRQEYSVTIVNRDDEREIYATAITYAMNSGIRKSEELMRDHAESIDSAYFAQQPTRIDDVYRRTWECEDDETGIEAIVFKVA